MAYKGQPKMLEVFIFCVLQKFGASIIFKNMAFSTLGSQ